MLTSKMNVHITMDVPEHNALAALPPFVISILSLTGLFSDGLHPHSEIYVTSAGSPSLHRNPKTGGSKLTKTEERVFHHKV